MAQYIYILVYFLFVEITIIYIINIGSKKLEQKKLVNLYMSTRVAKIIVSLIFLWIYSLVGESDIKSFALIFMLFYLFSIVFETWYFIKIERRIKERKKE